jgi:spore coat protein CotH
MQKSTLWNIVSPSLNLSIYIGILLVFINCSRDDITNPNTLNETVSSSHAVNDSTGTATGTPDSTTTNIPLSSQQQASATSGASSTTTTTPTDSTQAQSSALGMPGFSFETIDQTDSNAISSGAQQSGSSSVTTHSSSPTPDQNQSSDATDNTSQSSSATPTTSTFNIPLNDSADYLYDQSIVRNYYIILDPDSLAYLDNDPGEEDYVGGSIVLDGDTIGPVGIRYNGEGCVGNSGSSKNCPKLSMKVDLTWSSSNFRIHGKKRLNFKAMLNDETQMRERLGFWMFNKMGVPAPRAVHAKITVNNTFAGLFTLIEDVDEKFTKSHFPTDGDGNLYKETWPTEYSDTAKSTANFENNLETNKSDGKATLIKGFADIVTSSSSPKNAARTIETYMHIPTMMNYIAVDRAIRNDQGIFHWDCNSNSSNPNCEPENFFWYEEPGKQQLSVIPWDLDHAFENITGANNETSWIKDDWNVTSSCTPFAQGTDKQVSAACDDIIEGLGTFTAEYAQAQARLKPIMSEAINFLDHIKSQISAPTEAAYSDYGSEALQPASWESAVSTLRGDVITAKGGLP